MSYCYIFDIDGTLSDPTHRLHYVQQSPKDWRAFFAAVGGDKPVPHMIELVNDLYRAGADIVYVSGRSDECREATLHWLRERFCPKGPLYMRKAEDYRPDDVVKSELLVQLRAAGYEPIMAFDDRNSVVANWRRLGVPCAQVAEGDF